MKPKPSPHSPERRGPAAPRQAGPKGPSQRQLRVAEELRHLLSDVFGRVEFHDKALAGVRLTISEVRMSPDLKHATLFVTRLGNRDVTPLLPALRRAAPFLRAQIAPKLSLRVTPDLKFLQDEALDEAMRINKLLKAPQVARDLAAAGKAALAPEPGPLQDVTDKENPVFVQLFEQMQGQDFTAGVAQVMALSPAEIGEVARQAAKRQKL